MNRTTKILMLSLIMSLCIPFNMDAQYKSNKKKKPSRKEQAGRKKEERDTIPFVDHLSYDIRLGNIGINNGFSLSLKPGVGYNFNKMFTAGIGSKLYYNYTTFFNNESISLFSLGGFGFGRIKFGSIYLQGEYNSTGFQNYYDDGLKRKTVINYPAVGGGYQSGNDKWKYGIELILPLSKDARYYGTSLEYWVNISYNF